MKKNKKKEDSDSDCVEERKDKILPLISDKKEPANWK
jgi:hypothetical protein